MVCDDWNPTPADLYETLRILAIDKYHAVPFDFSCPFCSPHPCVSSEETKVAEMEMLLDRIFLGYDGKSSGLQAILEPLFVQKFMKNRPVISHVKSFFFLFFFVLRLFTKIPWIHTEEFWAMWRDHLFLETTFDGQKIPDFLEFLLKLLVLVDG